MDKQNERWWDWPAAAFLLMVMFCAAARLQTTNWTEHLGRIQLLVMAGTGLGLALGYSAFRGWGSLAYGAVMTVAVPGWALADLIRSDSWLERASSLLGRLGAAVAQLVLGQSVQDPILFLTVMALLFWISGLLAGYQLVRHGRPWAGLAVPGVVTLVVEYSFDMYSTTVVDQGILFAAVLAGAMLLLAARVYYLSSRKDWQSRRHMVESEVGNNFGCGAAVICIALVGIAWYSPRVIRSLTPGTSEQRVLSEDVKRARERFDKAVASLRSQAPMTVEGLGDSLALGTGTKLNSDVVMYVTPVGGKLNEGRFYWAGRVYDSYVNDTWQSTQTQIAPMGPDELPLQYSWQGRVGVSVEFLSRISYLKTLYFPSGVTRFSRPVQGVMNPSTLGETDVSAVVMDPPLRAGESYQILAMVSVPSVTMLQTASTRSFPLWVTSRYLQVPEDFSPKVQELAKQITQGRDSQYDQVTAVTEYLRKNIEYEPVLSSPPPAVDPTEWFLFEHKKGFCTYYATAEVLMLRSLGIPARLVVGYAEGQWVDDEKRFVVLGKDFHAWPEVYFNDLGWVPFEPTSAQPALDYPQDRNKPSALGGQAEIATPFVPPTGGEQRADQLNNEAPTPVIILLLIRYAPAAAWVLLVLALAGGFYKLFERPIRARIPLVVFIEDWVLKRGWRVPSWLRRSARLARRTPMEKLFARVGQMLRLWNSPPQLAQTPAEQVAMLTALVPEVAEVAQILLEEYHRAAYGPQKFDYDRARQAADTLRRNGAKAWLARNRKMKGVQWARMILPRS